MPTATTFQHGATSHPSLELVPPGYPKTPPAPPAHLRGWRHVAPSREEHCLCMGTVAWDMHVGGGSLCPPRIPGDPHSSPSPTVLQGKRDGGGFANQKTYGKGQAPTASWSPVECAVGSRESRTPIPGAKPSGTRRRMGREAGDRLGAFRVPKPIVAGLAQVRSRALPPAPTEPLVTTCGSLWHSCSAMVPLCSAWVPGMQDKQE